jgi:phage-related protein (TIGR01555 family)
MSDDIEPQQNYLQRLFHSMRVDGWQNLWTGLGTSTRDKRMAATLAVTAKINDSELDCLYIDDDTAARIVDTLPEECLKKGFSVKIRDEENPEDAHATEEAVQKALKELDVQALILEAYIWDRLYGGSIILIGAKDGASTEQMIEPLAEERISEVSHLTVIDKRYVVPATWYDDLSEPKYGEVKTYRITPTQFSNAADASISEVHESRMIVFGGQRVPVTRRQQNQGWGDSVLQKVNGVLRDYQVGWDSVGHLLTDASQGVFKMKGLMKMIASQNSTTLTDRMTIFDIGRSVARSVAIDADHEDFERQPYNFGSVDKILQMFILRMSSAAKIPATILMGQSPAGQNATGDADFEWFHATCESVQENYLTPRLERIVELILLSKDGPTGGVLPEDWSIVFEPLRQLSPDKQADMRLKVAQADKIYFDMGTLLAQEVALSRFKSDGWSAETTIDLGLREDMLKIQAEKELDSLENPPEPPPALPPALPPGGDPDDNDPTQGRGDGGTVRKCSVCYDKADLMPSGKCHVCDSVASKRTKKKV